MLISKIVGKFTAPGKEVKTSTESLYPEVAVSIASVKIETITEKNNMLNINAKAEGAQYAHTGYIAKNEPLAEVIKKAHEEGTVLCLRFEKKRKKNVDPNLPIEDISQTLEIAQKNIIKMLSGCYDFNTKTWVLTNEAESNPNDDPDFINHAIANLNFDGDSLLNPEKNVSAAGNAQPTSYPQNREKENKENALISMYIFVKEQELKHEYELTHEQREKIALNLLKLADVLQMKSLGMEVPSYAAYSHTRARFLVFKIAETFKPMDKTAIDDFSKWLKSSMKLGIELWTWGIDNS